MKRLIAIGLGLALAVYLLPFGGPPLARADATFTVNNNADTAISDGSGSDGVCETALGNGVCTLRAAIQEANALGGSNTIVMPVGTFTITGSGDDTAAAGDLDITQNLTINGSSAAGTLIVGTGSDRLFHILNGATVTISNVTVRNGGGVSQGGGILLDSGTLTLNNSRVGDSSVGNGATNGAGIYQAGGTLAVNFTTVTMNIAAASGGGIYFAGGSLTINNSTLGPANTAVDGAGLYVPGGPSATINNSTFSGNSASGTGGAIFAAGTVNLNSDTLAANSGTTAGGGIYQLGGTVNLRNSLVATNTGGVGPDCSGTVASEGYNLVGIIDGCNGVFNGVNGDQAGNGGSPLDPHIGSLGNNGGLTNTHALNSNSTAIDAGNPSGCGNGGTFTNDQRGPGFPRTVDGNVDGTPRCDIGAVESGPIGNTVTPSMTFTPSNTPTPTITETSAPSATATLTLTPAPTSATTPTPSPTFTLVAGGKLPVGTSITAGGGGTVGGGGVTNLAASQTSAALATQASFSPTPSATLSEADKTATDVALTALAPAPAPTTTPIPSITPTFSLPEEDVSLSTSRIVGVDGGVVTCGIWYIEVQAATVADKSVFQCETISPEDEAKASLPLNHRAIWHIVDVRAVDPAGAALTHFNPPLKACAYYAESQLESVGGDPSRFIIYTSDGVTRRWTSLITTAEEGVPRVCADTDRLSLFRLVAQPSDLVGKATSPLALGITAGVCCLLLLLVGVLVLVLTRRRAPKPPEAPAAA